MPQVKAITLTPQASDRNGLSVSETLLAARTDYLFTTGAFVVSGSYDRDAICASQTPTSSTLAMTLTGNLDYRDRRGCYVLIYAAADDTARTFTVVGTDINGGQISEAITGPGLGLIVLGSTKFYRILSVTADAATAGAIEVGVNGYCTFATPQHIQMYHASTDVGDIDTVHGYDRYGNAVTDAITAVSAGVSTDQDVNFAWVDRISSGTVPGGATEAGVDGLCESQWFVLNYRGPDFNIGIGCELSGTATYAVQHTFNNVLANGFVENDATVYTHSTLTGETTNQDDNYTNPPVACRLAITAHTSGTVTMRIAHVGRS